MHYVTSRTRKVFLLAFALSSGVQAAESDSSWPRIHGVTPFGRLHEDYSHHRVDALFPADPVDGPYTRRARLGLKGKLGDHWSWDAEYDFANNKTAAKDVKLMYKFDNGFRAYVGNQKQPYNLALEMGSNDIPFAERSIDNALLTPVADRAKGFRVEQNGQHWFAAAGVFTEAPQATTTGNDHWAGVGRFVYTPVHNETSVTHLGMRALYRRVDPQDSLSFSTKTTPNSGVKIASSGNISGIDTAIYYGPEFAFVRGPLMVFGEYNAATLQRPGLATLNFTSWHVAGTWSLTGESRAPTYAMDAGEFKGLKPAQPFNLADGGWGAWELAARLADIDIDDANVHGGTETTVNASVNWYPNNNIRLLFDWTHVLKTDGATNLRAQAEGMDVFTLRAQYMF